MQGRVVAYMRAHSSFGAVHLVAGTEPFNGNQLPLGSGVRFSGAAS